MQGATAQGRAQEHRRLISIRAPLAGSDGAKHRKHARHGFQSALPLRGATPAAARAVQREAISIRAPLAGSDDKLPWFGFPGQISIRAPLAGSDMGLYPQ